MGGSMASMYYRVSWKKKGSQQGEGRFEVICATESQCERYVKMLQKDPNIERVEVVKELITPKDKNR